MVIVENWTLWQFLHYCMVHSKSFFSYCFDGFWNIITEKNIIPIHYLFQNLWLYQMLNDITNYVNHFVIIKIFKTSVSILQYLLPLRNVTTYVCCENQWFSKTFRFPDADLKQWWMFLLPVQWSIYSILNVNIFEIHDGFRLFQLNFNTFLLGLKKIWEDYHTTVSAERQFFYFILGSLYKDSCFWPNVFAVQNLINTKSY